MSNTHDLAKGVYQEGVRPFWQNVHLSLDMEKWTFYGESSVFLIADNPVKHIDLNAFNLSVLQCLYKNSPLKFKTDNHQGKRLLRIYLPENNDNFFIIDIKFNGIMHSDQKELMPYNLSGLYKSRNEIGEKDTSGFATSQCEEQDCCQIFPCIDHPAAKTTFFIRLTIPKDMMAISCMDIAEEKTNENGSKTVVFHPTPPMSSYLLYFGAGKFETISEQGRTLFRAITPPGKSKYAEPALKAIRRAVEDLEKRFGIPYPLPKLDIIAVPEFLYGAMENWGALAHRENLMLYYPGITTENSFMRIVEVINHEVAHQWFGNLVSPKDWKYIWLNETLATYFGYRLTADHHPEWPVWPNFILDDYSAAMKRSSFVYNFPTELPDNCKLGITMSTAPIVYGKGACLFRQAIDFLGDEKIRQGLAYYLNKFSYGNTDSKDFYRSLWESAGKEIDQILRQWIERAGHPLVTVRRTGNVLHLSQKRHTYLPNDDDTLWPIPIKYTCWRMNNVSLTKTVIMTEKEMDIELPEDFSTYKLNTGQSGFYRVEYPIEDIITLLNLNSGMLEPIDMQGLEDDLYAMIKDGSIALVVYTSLVQRYFIKEQSYLSLMSLAENLLDLYRNVHKYSLENIIVHSLGWHLSNETLSRIGYTAKKSDSMETKDLRIKMMHLGLILYNNDLNDFTDEMFKKYLGGEEIESGLRSTIFKAAAHNYDDMPTFLALKRAYEGAESQEVKTEVLSALGYFRDPLIVQDVCEYVINEIPPSNQFIVFSAFAKNPRIESVLFDIFKKNEKKLRSFPGMALQRIIIAVCENWREEDISPVEEYFSDYGETADIHDAVKYGLEILQINQKNRYKK